MGIEPTRSSREPHTGFEDQERHQTPVTSEQSLPQQREGANNFLRAFTSEGRNRNPVNWPV